MSERTVTATRICVNYKNVEGVHVFTSKEVSGLYVASKSAEIAYNDVGHSIELLVGLNTGIKVRVTPELEFKDFVRRITTF